MPATTSPPVFFSLRDTTVVLNGHTIDGWSDDQTALQLPRDVEQYVPRYGPDGGLLLMGTGMEGGPVMISVFLGSVTDRYLAQQIVAQRNGAPVEWSGSVRNSLLGLSITLEGGGLVKASHGLAGGKGNVAAEVYHFEFQRVIRGAGGGGVGRAF